MPTVAKEVTVSNSLGLHARPAMQFVELAQKFDAAVIVQKLGEGACEVDGKSVMQMITLEATQGTRLVIRADGGDAQTAVEQLVDLFDKKFFEE